MPGPKARSYKSGSIIYFENDTNSNEIYILHTGRVVLISTDVVSGDEIKEDVQRGEFFGVKSALGHYPREETAQVIGSALILVFTTKEFEQLAMKNIPLTMKMLRVFSHQLRVIGRDVRKVLGESESSMPATELLNVGEYFFKDSRIEHATYVFEKYKEYYPTGRYIDRATRLLSACRSGESYPMDLPPLEETQPEPVQESSTYDNSFLDTVEDEPAVQEEEETPKNELQSVLYKGINYFAQEAYDKAIECFNQILTKKSLKNEEELQIFQRAFYEFSRTLMVKGELDKAAQNFTNFIKKFGKSNLLKGAIFNLAEIYEKQNKKSLAVSFYQKVIKIPPKDAETTKAYNKLRKLS